MQQQQQQRSRQWTEISEMNVFPLLFCYQFSPRSKDSMEAIGETRDAAILTR